MFRGPEVKEHRVFGEQQIFRSKWMIVRVTIYPSCLGLSWFILLAQLNYK